MSSDRKDARWALATKVTEAAGFRSPNDLPYPNLSELLASIDVNVLAFLGPTSTRTIVRNAEPGAADPKTLGDIAEVFRGWRDRGLAVESIRYALDRVAEEPR